MKHLSLQFKIIFLTLLLSARSVYAQEIQDRPNIIVVLIDDMGWNDTGFSGHTLIETPKLDQLAATGVIFTNAYAAAPNCAPSRASLLTGLYTPHHGVYTVIDPRHDPGMPHHKIISAESERQLSDETITIAEHLFSNGYRTGMFGMWNLGRGKSGPASPRGQGFEFYREPKDYGFEPNEYYNQSGDYLTDRLTEGARTFIKDNRNSPFFLYVAYHGIHAPFNPPEDLLRKYSALGKKEQNLPDDFAEYAATVESVDRNIGRLWDTVIEFELEENTYLFFTSDNGGVHQYTAPLREGKGTLYEGGIRVPAFITGPAIPSGQKIAPPISSIDFFPTISSLTGSPSRDLDGEDLSPLLQDGTPLERDLLFWHFPCYTGRGEPVSALRKGDYKLIEFFESGKIELYDLKNDPSELQDLWESEQEMGQELYGILRNWQHLVSAPRPTDPNPSYDPSTESRRGPRQSNKKGDTN